MSKGLVDVERLGDVVVGAQLQTLQLITAFVFLRQEDHRHVAGARGGAQNLTDLKAVHIGQHDVQDDEVGEVVAGFLQRIRAAQHGVHIITLVGKVDFEHVGDVDIVFNDQQLGFSHFSLLIFLRDKAG